MPMRSYGLCGGIGNHFLVVDGSIKCASVTHDDQGDPEGSCEVAQKCYCPVPQHLHDAQTSVQDGDRGVLFSFKSARAKPRLDGRVGLYTP